ncbi:MAG: hypothetical protein WCK89_23070 [bacterium]
MKGFDHMSQSVDHEKTHSAHAAPTRILCIAGGVAVVAAAVAAGVWWRCAGKPSAAPDVSSSSPVSAAAPVLVEFEALKGKWLRPDGGYVLELKRLLPQNELEAAYFNPNPIHVGKARLTKERGFVKVFVELQDVNYPGSTYTLIYDKENDQLRGIYYQATQQQEFDIFFTRLGNGG